MLDIVLRIGSNDFSTGSSEYSLVAFLDWFNLMLFPLWQWELMLLMPFALACLIDRAVKDPHAKPTLTHLTLFITVTGFAGMGHATALIQAVDTFLGGTGVCPTLYAPGLLASHPSIDTSLLCHMAAAHVCMIYAMGVGFAYLLFSSKRRVPETDVVAVLRTRCGVYFLWSGVAQALPYWSVCLQHPELFVSFMTNNGWFSNRPYTPGFTEFACPAVWICSGVYFLCTAKAEGKSQAGLV